MVPTGTEGRGWHYPRTVLTEGNSDLPTGTEVQALDDGLVAAITLLNELRAAVIEKGRIKGAA